MAFGFDPLRVRGAVELDVMDFFEWREGVGGEDCWCWLAGDAAGEGDEGGVRRDEM